MKELIFCFQELQSERGEDAANKLVLTHSALHHGDNDSPRVDPQELVDLHSW